MEPIKKRSELRRIECKPTAAILGYNVDDLLARADIAEWDRELRERITQWMKGSVHRCDWGYVVWERDRSSICVGWTIDKEFPDDNRFYIHANAYIVPFVADSDEIEMYEFTSGTGGGSKTIEVREGVLVMFDFMFYDQEPIRQNKIVAGSYRCIRFFAGVPLTYSQELKAFSKTDSGVANSAAKKSVDAFLETREALNDVLRKGIIRIKEKELSPEVEADEIEDLRDYVDNLRRKLEDSAPPAANQ